MATFNKVIVMGNLTREPELRQAGASQVCELSLALNRVWTKDGQKQEEVSYIDVICWGKTAEIAERFLTKGAPVLIDGRLQQDRWDDKESGQKRSKVKIVCEKLTLCGKKGESYGDSPPSGGSSGNSSFSPGGGIGSDFAGGSTDDIPF